MTQKRLPRHQQAQINDFRRWLVERVAETAWVFNSTMTNQEMALSFGVQPDVLVDARRFLDTFYRKRTEVMGLQPVRLGGSNRVRLVSRGAHFRICVPRFIYTVWSKYLEDRRLTPTILLRSLFHFYLSQKDYPLTATDWTYKGVTYEVDYVGPNYYNPWVVQCVLPYEMKALFSVRCKMIGVTMSDVARSLVLDLLHGKIADLQLITSASQLWSVDQYIRVDESVREATYREIRWQDARAKARPRWAKQRAEKKKQQQKEKANEAERADRSHHGHG